VPNSGLLILVPTLNERENIETALARIAAALPGAHILVVDDDSSDGTWQAAEAMKEKISGLEVMVRRGRPAGLGHAIRDAYRYALDHGYAQTCIVDCDLQQDPGDVAALRAAGEDAGVVIGSRYLEADALSADYDPMSRRLSMLSNFGTRVLFGLPVKDATTDFFLLSTRVLDAVPPESLRSHGHAFFAEVKARAARAGFRLREVSVPGYVRRHGGSKRSMRHVWQFAVEILALRWEFLTARAPRSYAES